MRLMQTHNEATDRRRYERGTKFPQGEATTASTSQVLWHAYRRDSPAVTAKVTSTPAGAYEVQIAFGTVAVQCLPFSSAAAAVEAVERILTQLEARGYQRRRRDKRTNGASC